MSKDYIEIREKSYGPSPYIVNSRIRILDIAGQYKLAEEAGEEPMAYILRAYPHLKRNQVKAAISYWRRHEAEIAAELAADEAILAQIPTRI